MGGFKRSILILSAWLGLMGLAMPAHAIYQLQGYVYVPGGGTGTSVSPSSNASLAAYRWGYQDQVCLQQGSSNTINANALYPAGGPVPAYFLSDTSSQWVAAQAAGQTVVAVVETRKGQFSWTQADYVAFKKAIISPADILNVNTDFGALTQTAYPTVSVSNVLATSLTLSWTGMADPQGIISSYTVYRATYAPAANGHFGRGEAWASVTGTGFSP